MRMSVWGKIVGGTAGFALGGPLGALFGALAGHAVDRMRAAEEPQPDAASQSEETRSLAFTMGVIVLGAKMAKADGRVTRDEIAAFREVFHVPPHEVKNVAKVFNMARQDASGYELYARQIAREFRDSPRVLEDLLDALFHIAKADGIMHPGETEFLKNIAEIFGFSTADYARIRAGHVGSDGTLDDPYAVLGVPHDIDDTGLKSAYRKLIRENHPDTLMAQGMPEEFIELANDKLAAINNAYDQIQKRRGQR